MGSVALSARSALRVSRSTQTCGAARDRSRCQPRAEGSRARGRGRDVARRSFADLGLADVWLQHQGGRRRRLSGGGRLRCRRQRPRARGVVSRRRVLTVLATLGILARRWRVDSGDAGTLPARPGPADIARGARWRGVLPVAAGSGGVRAQGGQREPRAGIRRDRDLLDGLSAARSMKAPNGNDITRLAAPFLALGVIALCMAVDSSTPPSVFRHLYLIPAAWAALRGGGRDGALTGLVAGLLQAPFALPAIERLGLDTPAVDGLVSMVMPIPVGWGDGRLGRQAARRRRG